MTTRPAGASDPLKLSIRVQIFNHGDEPFEAERLLPNADDSNSQAIRREGLRYECLLAAVEGVCHLLRLPAHAAASAAVEVAVRDARRTPSPDSPTPEVPNAS